MTHCLQGHLGVVPYKCGNPPLSSKRLLRGGELEVDLFLLNQEVGLGPLIISCDLDLLYDLGIGLGRDLFLLTGGTNSGIT